MARKWADIKRELGLEAPEARWISLRLATQLICKQAGIPIHCTEEIRIHPDRVEIVEQVFNEEGQKYTRLEFTGPWQLERVLARETRVFGARWP